MARVSQPVLPLLPGAARSVGPSVGLVEGPDGGVVLVFGLVTHAWAAGDELARRLAAVQLVTTMSRPVPSPTKTDALSAATTARADLSACQAEQAARSRRPPDQMVAGLREEPCTHSTRGS